MSTPVLVVYHPVRFSHASTAPSGSSAVKWLNKKLSQGSDETLVLRFSQKVLLMLPQRGVIYVPITHICTSLLRWFHLLGLWSCAPCAWSQRLAVRLAHICVADECFLKDPHIKDDGHRRRVKHAKQRSYLGQCHRNALSLRPPGGSREPRLRYREAGECGIGRRVERGVEILVS